MAWRKRSTPYRGDQRQYENYYGTQVGRGLPVFTGAQVQRGHGLGNLFSGLVRAAMPLVKSGVKALGKQGMKTGMQIAGDVLGGHNPKQAAKRRVKQAGTRLINKAMGPPGVRATRGRQQSRGRGGRGPPGVRARRGRQQSRGRGGRGRGAIKRRAPSRPGSSSRSKQPRDIFA